jgi:hypothetical protein
VAAPSVGGALAWFGVALVSLAMPGLYGGADPFTVLLVGGIGGAILGSPAAIIIGWPLHLLLLKLRWTHVAVYIYLGAMLGVIGFFTFVSLWSPISFELLMTWFVIVLAFAGAVGGGAFWLIRRPDRDAPPRVDDSPEPPDVSTP